MRFARFAAIALMVAPLLVPLAVHAQSTTDTTAQPPSAGAPKIVAPKPKMTTAQRFQGRFETANTTHDGHLTLEQAKANKWSAVIRRFSKVDTDNKGYVTAEELRADYLAQRAAKAKAKPAVTPATAAPARS
jgi:hypothetical protein